MDELILAIYNSEYKGSINESTRDELLSILSTYEEGVQEIKDSIVKNSTKFGKKINTPVNKASKKVGSLMVEIEDKLKKSDKEMEDNINKEDRITKKAAKVKTAAVVAGEVLTLAFPIPCGLTLAYNAVLAGALMNSDDKIDEQVKKSIEELKDKYTKFKEKCKDGFKSKMEAMKGYTTLKMVVVKTAKEKDNANRKVTSVSESVNESVVTYDLISSLYATYESELPLEYYEKALLFIENMNVNNEAQVRVYENIMMNISLDSLF